MASVLLRDRRGDNHREKGHVKVEAEIGLSDATTSQEPPRIVGSHSRLGERHGTDSPWGFQKALPTPWLQTLWVHAKLLQLCLTLCDPVDCSPPVSPVRGISQATILDWFAISFSRGSSHPRNWIPISYVSHIGRWVLYYLCHLGRLRLQASTNKFLLL